MKVKETMVFDLDHIMKVRKIINLPQLSLESGVPIKTIQGIYWNDIKVIPDGQINKLCEYLQCDLTDMLSDYDVNKLEERRKFFKKTSFFKDEGIIYFIKSKGGKYDGLTKIGFSSDVISRINTLGYELSCEFETKLFIPSNDVINLEKLMHKIFKPKHVKGEWFDLKDEDIEFLK